METEILPQAEKITKTAAEASANFSNLDEAKIADVVQSRKKLLESIKPAITLKNYYFMEEKILTEEKRLKEILDWRMGRQSSLSRYSLILNPNYFEQEFLN